MDNKLTLKDRILNEFHKPGFRKALGVFFVCVIGGIICGFIFSNLQLASTLGVGLGLIWMGVAYFNQDEEDKRGKR
ncbi:MAG TPA: hypothetical protein PKN96_09900 [Flavobacterium sp.]|uniref:hypothetical protein n=1 Tax=Flavobacterium sp. TaxID=239 RepID=UPI002B895AFB|nr:hypothetical protein [Flavobacterium sp.]HNP33594.1 hypothetical protein [Flavobacterium sp.]